MRVVVDVRTQGRWLVLRTAWLFLGAAIGLAAVLLALSVAAVLDPLTTAPAWFLNAACLTPLLLLGLLPGVRELEVTAARSLLGVRRELVAPARPTGTHRALTASWAVLHLAGGLLTAVALVGVVPGAVVTAVTAGRGESLTVGTATVPGARSLAGAVALVAVCLAIVLGCGAVAWLLGVLAARVAPSFLGPTPADRLEIVEARLAAEAEHVRLARDLHDGIGHALTIIAVQAAAGRRTLDADPESTSRALAAVEDTSRHALEDLDNVLSVLRDPAGPPVPEPGVDRLEALVRTHRDAGMAVTVEVSKLPVLPAMVSSTVYRVAAEGLANAHRYAGTGDVLLVVASFHDSLEVTIGSRRPGALTRPRSGGGRGIAGLRERVIALGGSVTAGPIGDQWRLRATIPVPTGRDDR